MSTSAHDLLQTLGVSPALYHGGDLAVRSPIDGALLGQMRTADAATTDAALARSQQAQLTWRLVPAPRRGELLRLLGEELRVHKPELAALLSLEVGKIGSEALGEVQEMIDMCDFALGLSRQLYGLTIASERPGHRMMEQWHPLGVVAVISAFNFPLAVWAWNAALALVCGNAIVWKPSEKAPLCALAAQALLARAMTRFGADAPAHLSQVLVGGAEVGAALAQHPAVALLSATGSTRMGRVVGPQVAARFGRSLLELGGNNAVIVAPSADLSLALRAIIFGAYGTAGQRCTSTRRVIIHASIFDALLARLEQARASLRVGNPRSSDVLVGPLIDRAAFEQMQQALTQARAEGSMVSGGERVLAQQYPHASYVTPALVTMSAQTAVVSQETFAPILYALRYDTLAQALALHNAVPQGLSSALFSNDLREAEQFMSVAGSDCGIANVNLGTSGAEIGGAFGGEKHSGGGREAGSDAWRNYMRRATNTVNYSNELPLAQGVKFDV